MAHIQIILSLLSLVGIGLALEKKFNIRLSVSILYSAIFTSFILYVGGLQNKLELSVIAVRIFGWICFAVNLQHFKNRKTKGDEIYIFLFAITFYVFCQTAPYSIFPFIDDYSHWGRMSRYIAENNRLLLNSDQIGIKDYPPIVALFHYSFSYFSGYQDNIAVFANGLLTILFSSTLLIPVAKYTSEEKKWVFTLTSFVIYSYFWIFGLGLHSLWVDTILGFSFGIALYLYFNNEWDNKNIALLATLPIIMFTVQIKQIGILFAMFTLAIIGLDYLKYDKEKPVKKLFTLLLIVLVLIFFEWTWKNHLAAQGISSGFKADITLNKIISALNPLTATERQVTTIKRFFSHFLLEHHLSTFWLMITAILTAGILIKRKTTNLQLGTFILNYIIFAVYLSILLLLYMFTFSEYEGTRLASIERYTLTFILGLLVFLTGTLINISSGEKTKKFKIYIILVAVLVTLPNMGRMILDITRVGLNTYPSHTAGAINAMSKFLIAKTPINSKIYIIWSEGSNDESVIFSYFLMPRVINSECSYVRPVQAIKNENDAWSCLLSLQQFKDKLSGYDYLYVAKSSEEFASHYLKNLNINYDGENPVLFKIEGITTLQFKKIE
jgi:hypothetical protein